jgi:hypothetical protein
MNIKEIEEASSFYYAVNKCNTNCPISKNIQASEMYRENLTKIYGEYD